MLTVKSGPRKAPIPNKAWPIFTNNPSLPLFDSINRMFIWDSEKPLARPISKNSPAVKIKLEVNLREKTATNDRKYAIRSKFFLFQ